MNEKLKQKYIGQFEDLIKEGKVVLSHRKSTIVIGADDYIPLEIFQPWRTRCVNLLNAVVPSNMLYYDQIKHYPSYTSGWTEANEIFGTLQGIYEDFKSDFLNSLALQVEGQIAVDYLQQASDLLCEKDNIQYSHVPAAVLTGVVLEKSIRVLCEETIQYRDELAKKLGAELIVGSVQESIDKGRVKEETGYYASRNKLQTTTLLDTLEEYKFDAAIGGARRDEEKARAKERFFSHRDEFGQWNPKNQRPELWNIFNGRKNMGEHFRVFPISNWTEMDVWQYIFLENIPMPSCTISTWAANSILTANI